MYSCTEGGSTAAMAVARDGSCERPVTVNNLRHKGAGPVRYKTAGVDGHSTDWQGINAELLLAPCDVDQTSAPVRQR